jgi:hypothetical protein
MRATFNLLPGGDEHFPMALRAPGHLGGGVAARCVLRNLGFLRHGFGGPGGDAPEAPGSEPLHAGEWTNVSIAAISSH